MDARPSQAGANRADPEAEPRPERSEEQAAHRRLLDPRGDEDGEDGDHDPVAQRPVHGVDRGRSVVEADEVRDRDPDDGDDQERGDVDRHRRDDPAHRGDSDRAERPPARDECDLEGGDQGTGVGGHVGDRDDRRAQP